MIQLSTVCVSHESVYTFLALVTQSELIVVYTPIIPLRGLPIEKGLSKGAWMRESYAKKNECLCLPLELSGGYSHTRATLGELTFPALP